MYIDLLKIAWRLQEKFNVEIFNISTARPVTDLFLLPHTPEGEIPQLDPDCAYICEYRDLRYIDPKSNPAPLICIAGARSHPDDIYFIGRQAIVVYHSNVSAVMLELGHVLYICGNESSQILDASKVLLHCRGIGELMDAAYEFLKNPLIVTDVNQRLFACTPSSRVADSKYQEIIEMPYIPVGHPSLGSTGDCMTAAGIPFLDQSVNGFPAVMCKELKVGESTIGYLHLLQCNHPLAEEDTYIMELMGNLLALELWKQPAWNRRSPEEQTADFLRGILDNQYADEAQIAEEQIRVGLKTRRYMRTVIIKVTRAGTSPHVSLYDLAKQFAALLPETFGFLYKNSVVLLISSDSFYQEIAQVLKPITSWLEQYHMAAGVSNPIVSLLHLRNAGYQSNIALELGTGLSNDVILEYKDYGVFHMISLGLRSEPIENFLPPELIALMEYCSKTDDTLLETLRVYLDCGCSSSVTAEKLYIHKNTLRYRLMQIEKIMNLSVKEGNNHVRLSFALQILDYADRFLPKHELRPELSDA